MIQNATKLISHENNSVEALIALFKTHISNLEYVVSRPMTSYANAKLKKTHLFTNSSLYGYRQLQDTSYLIPPCKFPNHSVEQWVFNLIAV
ncbi:hypothetical protein BN7_2538 [Wickerhamomyces ciferrii]|uniref:Uncharacterized protein n=1 Tax=Wickerhamomyces ciferrii (strain ATCC 14091 / BCRC 22168 / CBS 111 / JCM 3599 / NBRC 0793 / NRRL Y-1031 F-60-10) TaxID=1206466 RepID=K0KLB0_WICCF|nr:uncharacterized protein BN7_2538 [Wickerhamomyces ciferrii]CCH42992.1 hypothetical protein BN7_2538 [Wickerhamomyces ciferrii]